MTLEEAYLSSVFDDPDQRVWYLAGTLYPNEKHKDAIRRFVWRKGLLYHRANDDRYYLVVAPDASVEGWLQSPGTSKTLSTLAGLAAGAKAGGIWGTVVGGAAGSTADEGLRQYIRSQLLHRPDYKLWDIIKAAAAGAAGPAVVKTFSRPK